MLEGLALYSAAAFAGALLLWGSVVLGRRYLTVSQQRLGKALLFWFGLVALVLLAIFVEGTPRY